MSPQEAISIMEPLEERFHVLKWRARWRNARLTNPEDTRSYEIIEPYDRLSEVTCDLLGGRYLVREGQSSEVTWGEEGEKVVTPVWITREESFDGETYRRMESHQPVTPDTLAGDTSSAFPWVYPTEGCIARDKDNLFQPDMTHLDPCASGLEYMPPHCSTEWTAYDCQRFSTLVQTWVAEGKDISIVEDAKGAWTLSVKLNIQATYRGEPFCPEFLFRFSYDAAKGGVVTGVRWIAPDEKGEFTIENGRVEIDLQEVGGGFWAPKTIKHVNPWDKRMTFISCEALEVNPPVTAETFRLDFPQGVYIDDYVNRLFYVTGTAVDRQSATREFMVRHNLQEP
jgi:hypothetical protein